MGRAYAGVLGMLAFLTVLVRCVVRSVPVETTIGQAIACLVTFATIGAVVGQLAGWIIDDSVRLQLAQEMADAAKSGNNTAAPAAMGIKN
jgi:hypothetical protein